VHCWWWQGTPSSGARHLSLSGRSSNAAGRAGAGGGGCWWRAGACGGHAAGGWAGATCSACVFPGLNSDDLAVSRLSKGLATALGGAAGTALDGSVCDVVC